jgi:putative transposase
MTSSLNRGRHSVTALKAHLVFVTKYRRKLFTSESLEFLKLSMEEIARKMEFTIVEFNGESEHIHILVNYPPKYSISKIVNHLKGASSRLYRSRYPNSGSHLWSPAYFASSVGGAPIQVLKEYIKNQKSP